MCTLSPIENMAYVRYTVDQLMLHIILYLDVLEMFKGITLHF